ncbi:Rec8 like protein-domain-containing protein [Thamnocephalis sphaerospora]|uniref:Rec8 like protein-domain-containing protein n=1 Tax=Thamnocephalis sphaerospora TaxID=78915 RepID=A0A4P9XXQ1_9FUNG|nr:Rec8 like protein-domain-containing protein [Thamnocephalis sphaerospora]|eukprot:RKP11175.1 Rec8 like protein-domain-containing protein [Thamnocephalis sphaerospora]
MFYHEAILAKKGPLARVWLAAHWERKMSKTQFIQTNIQSTVGAIVGGDQPPMALRISGQLLLGVVRIYSRKARYLLEDCNEALVKLKMAFRTGAVDLPAELARAALHTITVGNAATEFDILLPETEYHLNRWNTSTLAGGQLVARVQDITIRESYFAPAASLLDEPTQDSLEDPFMSSATLGASGAGSGSYGGEDDDAGLDFGDLFPSNASMGVEMARDAQDLQAFEPEHLLGEDSFLGEKRRASGGGFELDADMDVTFDDAVGQADVTEADGHAPLVFDDHDFRTSDRANFDADFDGLGDLPSIGDMSAQTTGGNLFNQSLLAVDTSHTSRTGAAQRRRRRVLVDEVTELSRQQMTMRPTAASFAALLDRDGQAASGALGARPHAVRDDPASYYLGPSTADLPPELASMFQRAQKRAGANAMETPRAAKQQRVDPSLMAPIEISTLLHSGSVADMSTPQPASRSPNLGDKDDRDSIWMADGPVFDAGDDMLDDPVADLSLSSPVNFGSGLTPNVKALSLRNASTHGASITTETSARLFDDESASQSATMSSANGSTFSKNTARAAQLIRDQLRDAPSAAPKQRDITFRQVAGSVKRSDAARLFFELLVLNTKDLVRVQQAEPFADIRIQAKDALFESDFAASAVY